MAEGRVAASEGGTWRCFSTAVSFNSATALDWIGYEPDTLLMRVSGHFPRLCIVPGWVAPGVHEQAQAASFTTVPFFTGLLEKAGTSFAATVS